MGRALKKKFNHNSLRPQYFVLCDDNAQLSELFWLIIPRAFQLIAHTVVSCGDR